METRKPDFENDYELRSNFVRQLSLRQFAGVNGPDGANESIPRTLIHYWHDLEELPDDVKECLESWHCLEREGFTIRMFDDRSANAYISEEFGDRELAAFARCRHPAMRSDYLRMCFILKEGGMYVDADDVLLGDGWKSIFLSGTLKLQPLCYDISAQSMVPASNFWLEDAPVDNRVFYVNNNPIAAPAGHPLLKRALARSTIKLLEEKVPNIQDSTGPGNMTVALVSHAFTLRTNDSLLDFELLENWDNIAETRWNLSYRDDDRNWRNAEESGF